MIANCIGINKQKLQQIKCSKQKDWLIHWVHKLYGIFCENKKWYFRRLCAIKERKPNIEILHLKRRKYKVVFVI